MPPKVKKRKANSDPQPEREPELPPIIFKSPGLTHDARLNVFGQEFREYDLCLQVDFSLPRNRCAFRNFEAPFELLSEIS